MRLLGRSLYTIRRFIDGARRVRRADLRGTSGHVSDPLIGLFVEFGGACPVQGYGEVLSHACYYRSRGEGWSFEVYAEGADMSLELPDPIFEVDEYPYFWPDGGWVSAEVSRDCILRAARKYASRGEEA